MRSLSPALLPRLATTLLGVALLLAATAALAPAPAEARSPKRLAPAIYTQSVQPAMRGAGPQVLPWTVEVVVRSDGRWSAGERAGILSRAELRSLRRAIRTTRYAMAHEAPGRPMCRALPVRRTQVKTARGVVSWSSPCSARPHESVYALKALVDRLVGPQVALPQPAPPAVVSPIRPPNGPVNRPAPEVVTYRVSSRDAPLGDAIVVRADGAWTRVDGRRGGVTEGALTPSQLAALLARARAATFAPAPNPPMCAARVSGFATLEAPGVGSLRWQQPCGQPHPTLAALLGELRRLTAR